MPGTIKIELEHHNNGLGGYVSVKLLRDDQTVRHHAVMDGSTSELSESLIVDGIPVRLNLAVFNSEKREPIVENARKALKDE